MKVEIDLNDILRDEYGDGEGLADSIRRQVIDTLVQKAKEGTQKSIDAAVSAAISQSLSAAVREQMPAIINDLMNTEYKPVDRYGSRSAPTSFRAELIKSIQEQMVYKRANYESDKNAFTKAVDSVISEKMTEFKSAWIKQVDGQFLTEAMSYAAQKLAERVGVKAR